MTLKELQKRIDTAENNPSQMLEIGKEYAEGTIIRDFTAAQAWLLAVTETGENTEAVEAMRILAEKIWKTEEVLTDRDYEDICRELETAVGERRVYLEKLEQLGTEKQRNNMTNKRCNGDEDFVY